MAKLIKVESNELDESKSPSSYECDWCEDKGWFEFLDEDGSIGRYDSCFKCGRTATNEESERG